MTSKITFWIVIIQLLCVVLQVDACADGYYAKVPCNDDPGYYTSPDSDFGSITHNCDEKGTPLTDFKCTAGSGYASACSKRACRATCGCCEDEECTAHCPTAGQYYNGASCQNCGVGTYSPGSVASCTNCPEGKYSAINAATGCTSCPANSNSPEGSSSCTCNTGFAATSNGGCAQQCSAGYTGPDGGPCTECVAGKYKTTTGTAACTGCPGNSISPSTSSARTACVCNAGYTGQITDTTGTCTACTTGNYKAGTGSALCTQCGPGKYSGVEAATASSTCSSCPDFSGSSCTSCTTYLGCACNAGYTGANGGPCTGCVSGKYKDVPGTALCSACPTSSNSPVNNTALAACVCNAGYTGANGGACTACVAGKYKAAPGTAACTSCAAGSYSPGPGAVACASCPSNSGASCTGCSTLSSCECNVGFTGFNGNCTACNAGKYKAITGSATCSTCPVSSGASCSGCTALNQCKCNAGFQGPSGGLCTTCPVNTGASCDGCTSAASCKCNTGYWGPNGGPCTGCPLNSGSSCNGCTAQSGCACNAGYFGTNGFPCLSCEIGTYRQSQSTTSCTNCSAGTYSSSVAATTCTTCPKGSNTPGTRNSNVSACTCNAGYTGPNGLPCAACAEAKYKRTSGSAECISCPDERYASNVEGTDCYICGAGRQPVGSTCVSCDIGKYSKDETNWKCVTCKSGFYTLTTGSDKCEKCSACPDGFYRKNCTAASGGGLCVPCAACESGKVNVGCMNRAGHTDEPGVCRAREYTVRTPQCDEHEGAGYGLGGYTFLDLFSVTQDDASFQCRHRCDGDQNAMSGKVYKKMTNRQELVLEFGENRTFNGGACNGPYACDVSSCVIFGSSDDSQQSFRLEAACPVFVDSEMSVKFWSAVERIAGQNVDVISKTDDEIVSTVNLMRGSQCESCDVCGQNEKPISDWGRGCARECTQIKCEYQEIYDWTEPDIMKKCKRCENLADRRLCKSSERTLFENYDVSGRLPKFYMKGCVPRMQNTMRDRETTYGSCVKCPDSTNACVAQTEYYHSCQETAGVCQRCINKNSIQSTYYDGQRSETLYCQLTPCEAKEGAAYTGISIDVQPQRMCYIKCLEVSCSSDEIELPCVLPHQKRCRSPVAIDRDVTDILYVTLRHSPAHTNILEPATETLHLFSSFENTLVDHDTSSFDHKAQCVWNADHILDNNMNPAGISHKFQDDCRLWVRDPRVSYPLMPLQNTVTDTSPDFSRRVLLNTSAHAVSYKRTPTPTLDVSAERQVSPSPDVFAADTYLELDLTSTTNATLAVFVPDDRNIDSIDWVPRWRVAVHARQISGGDSVVDVTTDSEETCTSCFSLTLK